jgi:hypothetical protein
MERASDATSMSGNGTNRTLNIRDRKAASGREADLANAVPKVSVVPKAVVAASRLPLENIAWPFNFPK